MEVDLEDHVDTLAQPEADQMVSRDVRRALESLAPGQRAVVMAISVDGRSVSETARTLGMNEGAVRVALHRGLRAIARRFGRTT